ncbi:MAG TPA: type VI secretion system baseplate subunit TssK [Polyangia bacterium]|nr:type VI secretion system baseplate subunit TssK [Polyangia bacterium]
MNAYKLARVRWYVGQTLLPEHLALHEEALLAEARLAARVRGLPSHGVARLAWNTQLLQQGELAIVALTALLEDGRILDVPGNATVAALDLRAVTSTRVSIYLHLLGQTQSATGNRLYEDDPKAVERVLHCLKLSVDASMPGAVASLKLLELKREVEGTWSLSNGYAPPLVVVGPSPFFLPVVAQLQTQLSCFKREVLLHLSDAYVARDRAAAVRRMLVEIARLEAMLGDLRHHVYPHPYQLFAALREFYFEVLCFFEAEPDGAMPDYHHDDPAASIVKLAVRLKQRLGHVRPRLRYSSFERTGAVFTIAPLPSGLSEAQEIYLLVQRPELKTAVVLDKVKLASPNRLPTVHRLSLRGVPFEARQQLPFPHAFGPEIDFYQIARDEEWSQVLNEGAICFYARPDLEPVKFSLFWRA